MDFLNAIQFSDQLTSSVQPGENDFLKIKELGFSSVINLATSKSDNTLQNEDIIVTNLGLNYVHIPIPWESPTLKHFQIFVKAMEVLEEEKVWLHCALNMRASCVAYLYTTTVLSIEEEIQREKMLGIWKPNKTWQTLITQIQHLNME